MDTIEDLRVIVKRLSKIAGKFVSVEFHEYEEYTWLDFVTEDGRLCSSFNVNEYLSGCYTEDFIDAILADPVKREILVRKLQCCNG